MIKTKRLAKWLDDLFPFNKLIKGIPGQLMEAVDGKFFDLLSTAAFSKVPEEHQEFVQQFLDAVVDGNYDAVNDISTDYLVELIKTPLGDRKEEIFISNQLNMIMEYIDDAKKKEIAAVPSTVGGGGPGGHPEGKGG